FDDRLTGNLEHFAPQARVAHIDIDPAEIGKNVETEIPVVADAKMALQALLERSIDRPDHDKWLQQLIENKEKYPYWYEKPASLLSPQWVIEQVHTLSGGDAIVTTDVGQHQMWRSEERRVGKECRSRRARWRYKKEIE